MSCINMVKPCVVRLPCARSHVMKRMQLSRQTARGFDPKFEGRMVGDNFGARDATPGEKESNFSEKTLGNYDTDHLTMAPEAIGRFVGLGSKKCIQLEDGCEPLSEQNYERLRQQVPGWRVIKTGDSVSIRQDFKCQDADRAAELTSRIEAVATEMGHPVEVKSVSSEAFAVLTSAPAGGLTENDFILAARINQLELTDLLAKKKVRYWA